MLAPVGRGRGDGARPLGGGLAPPPALAARPASVPPPGAQPPSPDRRARLSASPSARCRSRRSLRARRSSRFPAAPASRRRARRSARSCSGCAPVSGRQALVAAGAADPVVSTRSGGLRGLGRGASPEAGRPQALTALARAGGRGADRRAAGADRGAAGTARERLTGAARRARGRGRSCCSQPASPASWRGRRAAGRRPGRAHAARRGRKDVEPLADPFAWNPRRAAEFARRAAAGNSHLLYALSPGGVVASAERTARWRPLVERAAGQAAWTPTRWRGSCSWRAPGARTRARRAGSTSRRRAHADPRRDRPEPARHARRRGGQ